MDSEFNHTVRPLRLGLRERFNPDPEDCSNLNH